MLTQTVAGRVYDYSHAVGGRYLPQPVGLAIGAGDVVYILSRPSDAISGVAWNKTAVAGKVNICTIGTVSGDEEFVREFSQYGDDEGELIWPAGIALDAQQNVYVTDEWLNRISIFDKDGNFLRLWGVGGEGDGEFNQPSGIAIDGEDNLYIADSLNHRIQKFTKDGKFLGKWGSLGSGEGELNSPWGITIDDDGYVYVADHKNHRVQKFTSAGEFVAAFGSFGTGRGQLYRPSDVAVDPDGDVYVCDWANDRVQAFGPDGTFITSFIGDAQQLAKWHQMTVDANIDVIKARRRVYSLEPEWRFAKPTAVEFDPEKGRLLVADTQRGRLQIYNKLNDYLEAQFNL
ncbi:MAG: NHL repeat-containing protein [Chloroflexi bacterium]|nr:NHL repeat-containing protein [Chloroflexota bacterium]